MEKTLQMRKPIKNNIDGYEPTKKHRLQGKHYIDENEVVHGTLLNGKPTAGIAVRYTCFWNIYFESAVYFYVHPTLEKEPWDPDYTYGFGYFDWRSFRLSLIYGNWAVNRFPWNKTYYPNYGFLDGNFRLAANFTW